MLRLPLEDLSEEHLSYQEINIASRHVSLYGRRKRREDGI